MKAEILLEGTSLLTDLSWSDTVVRQSPYNARCGFSRKSLEWDSRHFREGKIFYE